MTTPISIVCDNCARWMEEDGTPTYKSQDAGSFIVSNARSLAEALKPGNQHGWKTEYIGELKIEKWWAKQIESVAAGSVDIQTCKAFRCLCPDCQLLTSERSGAARAANKENA